MQQFIMLYHLRESNYDSVIDPTCKICFKEKWCWQWYFFKWIRFRVMILNASIVFGHDYGKFSHETTEEEIFYICHRGNRME